MSIEGTGACLFALPYSFYVLEFWIWSIAESRPAAGRPHLASLLPLQDDDPAGLESGRSPAGSRWGSPLDRCQWRLSPLAFTRLILARVDVPTSPFLHIWRDECGSIRY